MRFLQPLDQFCAWLVKASWQAAVLVLLVLLLQWLLGKRLTPAWRYNLWLVVLVRLALPISPESSWSIFNYSGLNNEVVKIGQTFFGAGPERQADTTDFSQSRQGLTEIVSIPFSSVIDMAYPVVSSKNAESSSAAGGIRWVFLKVDRLKLFAGFWLAGFLFFSWRLFRNYRSLNRHLNALAPVRDPAVLKIWDQAREIMGCHAPAILVESDRVHSPALCGFFRFRLLIPPRMIQHFSEHELRLVFLHELAHIKRGDVQINWLVTFFQLLHWFNPVLWWGFKCMRTDREVASDALVLVNANGRERKAYGRTIIRLLEGFAPTPSSSGFVSLLEDDEQFRHRIQMMAAFQRPARWSLPGCSLLLLLGLVGLTDRPSPALDSTRADESENQNLLADATSASDRDATGIESSGADKNQGNGEETEIEAMGLAANAEEASLADDAASSESDKNVSPKFEEPGIVLDLDDLKEFLRPYGTWEEHPELGVRWTPTAAADDRSWRPYRDFGRWVRTDRGLYWKSEYVWGWVAFHYGRWALDEKLATWYWTPDSEWAPAWVTWRKTPHYYGWAPLPPEALEHEQNSEEIADQSVFASTPLARALLDAERFVFVPKDHVFDPGLRKHELSDYWTQRLITQSETASFANLETDDPTEFGEAGSEIESFIKMPNSIPVQIRDWTGDDSGYPRSEWIDFERRELYVFRPVLDYPPDREEDIPDASRIFATDDDAPKPESATMALKAPKAPDATSADDSVDADEISMTPSAPHASSIRKTVSSFTRKP